MTNPRRLRLPYAQAGAAIAAPAEWTPAGPPDSPLHPGDLGWAFASRTTGWLAGQGRCALIEPMGTHPAHRGSGYGREALRRVGDALAARGASGVCVLTPGVERGCRGPLPAGGLHGRRRVEPLTPAR